METRFVPNNCIRAHCKGSYIQDDGVWRCHLCGRPYQVDFAEQQPVRFLSRPLRYEDFAGSERYASVS